LPAARDEALPARTAHSASRREIVLQAVSAVRVATASRARHFAVASRARRGIAHSSGHIPPQAIVRPGADRQAATEDPAAVIVRPASSRPGRGRSLAPPRAASGNPAPSAPLVSAPVVPADSASLAVAAASANPPSASPATASQRVTAPQPPVRASQPAAIVRSVRVHRVRLSVRARASPAASVNPQTPASLSANHAQRVQAPVGLVPQQQAPAVPQGQKRIALPQPQVPVSPAPAHSEDLPVHPPRAASNPAASSRVANVPALKLPAVNLPAVKHPEASPLHAASRAANLAQETKAK
jgi:hypothetical protein